MGTVSSQLLQCALSACPSCTTSSLIVLDVNKVNPFQLMSVGSVQTEGSTTQNTGQMFTLVARYQGNLVAVRKVEKSQVDLKKDVITEVNEVRYEHWT